jgi:hypothetical protein
MKAKSKKKILVLVNKKDMNCFFFYLRIKNIFKLFYKLIKINHYLYYLRSLKKDLKKKNKQI